MVILYVLILGVFFSGLLFYLMQFVLVPYTSENVIDIQNLIIISGLFVLCVAFFLAFFHLLIDKLFFRKFYERPSVFPAIRRGMLLGVFLAGLAWLRIFNFDEVHIVLLIFSLMLLIEGLFLSFKKGMEEVKESREEAPN